VRPRALEPAGVALVDKPAGPSSFAIVAQIRRMTGAKTGHAGTLDPFATGLLLILSGRATRLQQSLVGLDKCYRTTIDLTATTTTGDPEGDVIERHDAPDDDLALDRLRGEIELPVPTASAVKVGGERAYKLHRRGIAVEMPVRRSTVYELGVIARDETSVTLDLRVSSGTYIRSIAQALGGHCRTLRRTAVGPFGIDEASPPERFTLLGEAEVLARL
jgi:tRNA pseudouridine55 synthase